MLTSAQYDALNPHHHVWVHASAGTGKTFILIYRILRLLLEGARPERIIALTFTQHAGKEMTLRLHKLLEDIMRSSDTCKSVLTMCLGFTPNSDQIRNAQKLWSQILDTSLNIQTLHSFCQNFLQTFSLEAGIRGDFKILDESQCFNLWSQQQETVCSHTYCGSPELNTVLTRLATRYSMHHITLHLWSLWHRSKEVIYPTKHFKLCQVSPPNLFCPEIMEQLKKFLDSTQLKNLEYAWNHPKYQAFFFTQKGTPRKKLLPAKAPESLKRWIEQAQEDLKHTLRQQNYMDAWQDTEDFCYLFSEIYNQYHQYKVKLGFLDFSDLIYKTIKLLEDPHHMGWIYSQLDRKIHHLLIDEAQDTSPSQWKVLELLSEVWNGHPHKTLFVVGDPKQSIYGFQGADLEQFFRAKEVFKLSAEHHKIPFHTIHLTHSFRTYGHILNVINCIFQNDPSMDFKIHTPLPHQQEGLVELWPMLDSGLNKSSGTVLAELWVKRIRHWISQGIILQCTGRAVQAEDILILISKRCSLYEAFSKTLNLGGFFVRESSTITLKDTLLAQDILALIQWFLAPHDNWSLVQVLKSPFFRVNEEEIFSVFAYRSTALKTFWDCLSSLKKKPWSTYVEILWQWKKMFFESTPFQFVQWWVYTPWIQERYTSWPNAIQILDKILASLFEFCQEQGKGWMEWIELFSTDFFTFKQKTEKGIGLLTIHSAKGLQSPIVIIPDVSMEARSKDSFMYTQDGPWKLGVLQEDEDPWYKLYTEKQAQEARRILYVAMTRAQERLYCSSLKKSAPYLDIYKALSTLGVSVPWDLDHSVCESVLRYGA
ncbi:ATP-dependent helicase/nuclease subunit A [Holospora obtusa F1]|uniref:DNA 3'-5' helicase n=1 Tax=Holospora obtusa F1 TaxID=1399147 RepID=W6TFF0_HOLOB|nr:UvrD-helicase domain-containing protein [Holospora obtusa]ETZ07741.1 ATP-dependent helicase/nuclease subunit A [Holospora obtusa F1]